MQKRGLISAVLGIVMMLGLSAVAYAQSVVTDVQVLPGGRASVAFANSQITLFHAPTTATVLGRGCKVKWTKDDFGNKVPVVTRCRHWTRPVVTQARSIGDIIITGLFQVGAAAAGKPNIRVGGSSASATSSSTSSASATATGSSGPSPF